MQYLHPFECSFYCFRIFKCWCLVAVKADIKSIFYGNRKTGTPKEWSFQLQVLYLEIFMLDFFDYRIFEMTIVWYTRPCFFKLFSDVFALNSSLWSKTHETVSWHYNKKHMKLFFDKKNQLCLDIIVSETKFWKYETFFLLPTTRFLFQTHQSPSICCCCLWEYRSSKTCYKGFFESKTKWVFQNCYSVWKLINWNSLRKADLFFTSLIYYFTLLIHSTCIFLWDNKYYYGFLEWTIKQSVNKKA